MAVKKKETAKVEKENPVVVEEPVVEENLGEDTPEVVVEEPEVVVEEPEQEKTVPEVKVDIENSVVKKEEQPERNVRIKMADDHKCNIGGQWYNLKKGQCYNVPVSVKNRLMQITGLLLPL